MEARQIEVQSLNESKTTSYQVSNQTAHLIRAYDLLSEIYSEVRASLECVYTEEDAARQFEKCMEVAYVEMEMAIFSLIQEMITDNRGKVGSSLI